jgi:type IV pilus assembly protein PilA
MYQLQKQRAGPHRYNCIRRELDSEGGFTLIELLVVIIIIGILATIAIPIFFNRRAAGYDAAAKTDVKQIATLQETYLSDNDAYAVNLAALTDFRPSDNTSLHATVGNGANDFTITVTSASGTDWCWDSDDVVNTGVYAC